MAKKERAIKPERMATKAEAAIIIIFMLLMLGGGSGFLGYNIRIMLIICLFFDLFMAARCGISWNTCFQAIAQKVGPLSGLMMILLGIGFVIGTWMFSGTVPVLVAWMAELINPKYILVLTFIFCSILSSAIGSNFTTGGTLGLVMFNVAMVQGLPAPIAAAACVCAANFGSFISPVADQPNNAAAINGYSVGDAMKHMLIPVAGGTIISCIFYFVAGLKYAGTSVDTSAQTAELVNAVFAYFKPSILVLLPVVLVVVLSLLKLPSAAVLFASGASAMVIGVVTQGFTFKQAMTAAYSGFSAASMLDGEVAPVLSSLVTRGGLSSMLEGIIFIVLAVMCTAVMSRVGCFELLGDVFNGFKSVGTLNIAAHIYVMVIALLTTDMAPTHVIAAETLQKHYARFGVSPKKVMAVSISSGRMITQILPWSFPAVYMATLYDLNVVDYLPYVIFFPAVILTHIVITFFGINNDKLSEEEAEKFGVAIQD